MAEEPKSYWHKNFPFIAETLTSFTAAFSNEVLWTTLRNGTQKIIRTQFPQFNRALRDEAMMTRMFEQLTDSEKKALEKWLCSLGERQREDFILSLAEVVDTPDDQSATTRTPEERERAMRAAVSYLKYLSALDDNGRRNASAAARRFMKLKESNYPQAKDLIERLGTHLGIQRLIDHGDWVVRAARQEDANDGRRLRIARKVAQLHELQSPPPRSFRTWLRSINPFS